MMPREGRRRRSPESSRRRRKERRNSREAELQSQQIPIHTATYHGLEQAEPLPALSRVPSTPNSTTSSDSSSSSTSSSLVNISQPLQRFGFGSFFSSGGNQQREHRAKKKKKRSRFLRFGNSSSSSLGSDLAYGKGYIDRRRSSREFSPPSKQKRRRPSPPKRSGTDEEIIELGRKFAELARQQQVEDLKASGKNRSSPAASSSRRSNNGRHARGIGSSRTHRESSPDDSEWESASEDESPSEDSDSGLAYGSVPSSIEKRVHVRSPARPSAEPIHNAPIRHKRSLVDPKLFGPVNSLHGYVNAPCGFETVDRDAVTSPRQHYEASIAPSETLPLQQLYPVPTSDPSQFDVDRGSVVSAQHDYTHRSQARSVPLQQPKPIVPVSTKVFETVETDPEYSRRSSAGDTLAKAAMADIAGAALSAALNAERKNEGSRYEERRDRDEKQSQPSSTRDYDEREEKRKTRDQLRENRRETLRERDIEVERTYVKETYHQERSSTEVDRENEKERRRRDKYRGDNDPNRDHVRSTVDRKDDQQRAQQGDRKERREEHSQEQGSASRSSNETISKHSVEPEHRSSADLIDPFQYQVADDAFPTPLHTTPKRSPTPNIVTVEREPDFSDLKFSHDPPRERPRERMSRKDSYELELQKSRDITVEQSPAPVNEVAPAEPAATLTTDDRRGRRRGRGGDSSSRHRSHHSQSPPRSRDRVQDDADRIWREEMLARRIRDESRRSRSNSPDSSVVDKWTEAVTEKRKEAGDSQGFEIVSPPETDSSKKQTSPYDAPNADVHVDNIFQHPNQLPFFQPPDSSVERERLVLNIIRPTPVPTPRSEGRNPQDYIEAEKSSETREQTKVEVSETAIDVALGPQGEVVSDEPTPAPVSAPRQVLESELASEQTHKQTHQQALIPSLESIVEEALEPEPAPAQVQVPVSAPASIHEPEPGTASKVVSWGENQTKRYSVDSPERGDDTLSGEKVTPAPETPKPRSVKKSSPWRTLANVVSIGGAGAAASVTKTNVDTDMTRHIKSEDREELPRSRSSLQYDTDESPPVPGPKPTNPRSAQMPGAFAEDPYFTATIAAGMEGSGFDPNLVINDPKFHTRDSAPGSNKSAEPPVTTETPEVVQEPEPVVNDPPKAPAEKNGLSIHNSAVLLKLVQKLKRKQQAKTKEKKNGTDKVTGIESSSAVQTDASRSSIEDNASISSAKLRKEIYERGDSNLKSEIRRDSKVAEDVPSKQKLPSELQFETRPQLYDSEADDKSGNASPRKKSKRLRKTMPTQQELRNLKEAESSSSSIPVDAPQEAQDTHATRSESKWDFLKLGKTSKNNAFDPNITMTMIPEDVQTLLAGSDKIAERGPDTTEPPTRPSLSSELSRDSSYRMVGSESTSIYEEEQSTPKSKKPIYERQFSDPPPRFALAPETSISSRKEINDDIVSMPNEEWSPLKKSKHRRNSFAAESPSAPEVSEQPAWRHSLDDYHPVSSAETGDGWDFLRRSKEVVQHESGAWGSPAYPKPTVEDVAENPKETTESLYDMRSVRTAVTGGQDTPKLNRSNGDSTPYEDLPSPSFSQFKESLGTMRSSARWDSHMSSISSTRRPRRRRSLSGVFPDEDEEPPDRRRDSLDASSIVSDSTFYTGHISTTRSRCPGDDLDDADSVASAPAQDRYDIRRPKLANTDKRNGKGLDLFNRFKSSIGIAEKERSSVRKPEEDGKNSFLAKAGTLGAGAGLADTVIAVASQASGSKATDAPSEKEAPSVPITPERRLSSSHLIDPEIVEREIRPAIDPQYGDLLPLPPTTPGTPVPELGDDIPPLPESRPGTPESDLERRLRSGKSSHVRRRSDNAVRARTPSQSAIPIHFRLKTTPTSPGNLKSSSALTSPTTVSPEYESPSRTRARPPSRDNTKAVKPLLLVQKASRELIEVSGQAQEESIASRELMHDRTLQALEERNDTNFSQIPMLSDESIQSPEIVPSTAQAVPDNEELAATSEADNVPDSPSDVFHDLPIISAYKETPDTDKIPTTIPHQSVELPQVEVHQADDSDLQEAMVNFMSSPQLPPWELVAPIGNLSPVPEPFDPMSKDRSSDLFQSSPSTHKFSDFDISEGRPSSEPAQEGTETGSITEHVSGDNMQDTSILVATATSGVTDELIASSIHDKQDHSEQFGKREGIGSNESKHVISSTSDFEAEANLSDPIDNIGSHERNIQDNDADQSGSVSTQKLEEVREELSDIDDEIDALSSKASQAPRELPLGPRASMWSGALPPAGLPSWSGAVYMLKGVPPRWSLGTPRRESLPQTALPSSKEDEDEEQPQTSSSIIHADIASSSLASSPVFETDQEQFFDAIADHVPSKQDVEEVIATNVSLEEANPDGTELEAGDLDAATADQDPGATPKKSESPQYQTTEPTTDEQTTLVTPQELTLAGHLIELLDQPTAKHADAAAPLAEPTQSIEQALLEEKAQKFPMETEVILQDQPGTSVPQESVSAEVESIDSVVTMERSKENEKKTETQEPNAEHGLQVTDVRDPTLEQQDSSLAQDEPFIQSPRDNEAPHQPAISRPSSPPARGKVSPEDTVDYSEAELQQSGVENHLVESSTDILAGSDGTLEPTENAGNDGQDISLEEVSAISHPPVQGEPALKSQFDSKLESESALGNELLSSDILSQDNKVVESTILENIEAKSDMEVSQTIAAIEPSLQVGNSQISESRSLEQADVEEQLWQPNIGGEPQTELHAARSDPHPHSDPQTESAPAENLHDNAPLYVEAVDNLLTSQTTTDEIAPTFPDPSSTEKTDAGNPVIEEPVIEQSNTEAVVTEQPATEELFTQAPVIEVPTITVSSVDEPSLNEPAADETLTEAHVTEKPIANESAIGAATPEEHAVEESIGVESHKDIESLADELTSKSAAQEDKKQRETALRSLHVEQAQVPSIANPSTYEPLSETSNTSEQLIDAVVVGDSAEMIVQTPTEPAMGDVWFEPIGSSMTSGSEEKSKAVTLDSGVEPMRIVEEAKPVEEPNPVEPTEPDSELEGTETVVTGLESTGEAESKPIERPTATEEGHNPVDEIRGAEGPKLVEELTLVEDPILSEASTATKEPKLAEEPTLVEEPQPAEERKLVEELTLVEDPDLPTEKSYDIQSSNEASGNTAQDPPQEHFLGHPVGEDLPLEPASPGKKSKKKKKKKSKARQSSDTSTLGVADPSKSVDEPITVESNDAVGQQDIPVSLFSSSETASASANQTMDKEPLKLDLQPNTIDANELKSLPSDPVGADVPTVNEVPIIAETITIDDSHTTPEAPLVSVASGANDPITCDVPVASDHIVTSDVPTTQDTTATEEAVVGTGSTMTNPSVAVIEDPITHEGYIPDVAAAGEVPSTTENPVANENPVTSESRTTDDAPVLSNVPVLSEISGTEETKKRSDTDDTIISEPSREVLESSKEREGLDVEVPGLEASVIDNEPYEIEERVNDDAISIPTYERQAPNEDENSSLLLDTDIAVAYSHSGRSQEVSHDEDEGPGYSITSPIIDKGKEDETLHQSVPHAETVEPIRGLEITRDHPDESSTADQLVQSSRAEDSVIEDGVLTKQVPIPQDEINESHETSDVHVLNDSIVSPGDAVITQRTPSTSIPLETMETSTSTPESIELPPVSRSQTDLGQESTDMPETRNLEQMAAGEMNTRDEGPLESILEDTVPVLTEVDPSDHSSPDVIDSARSNTDASRRSDSEITPDAQAPTEANDSVEESGEGGQSKTDNRDTEVHQDLEKPTAEITGADYSSEQEEVTTPKLFDDESKTPGPPSTRYDEGDVELPIIPEADEPTNDAILVPVSSTSDKIAIVTAEGEQDNKEGHAGHIEGEPAPESSSQPEFQTLPQVTVESTGDVHPDSTSARSHGSHSLEDDTSADLPDQKQISASNEVTPLYVPESASLTEGLSTERPVNPVEHKTVREPSPTTDVLKVGPVDVEGVTTTPALSEPMVGVIPRQIISSSPMENKADGAIPSQEPHVTPSQEQQDVLLPQDLAVTQLNEQPEVTPDTLFPDGYDVPLPEETQPNELAEPAEVTKEICDQASPKSQDTAPVQSEEPPHHHLDEQPIDSAKELGYDSPSGQGPKSETVVQADDSSSQPLQPNTDLAEPHQEVHEDTTAGEPAQASQSLEPVEHPSPQASLRKKSKKKKKRKSQVEPEPEHHHQLENIDQLQGSQEPQPSSEEPPVSEKEPELQHTAESASAVVQDEAIPEDINPQASPSKKSKKKKKKRASQASLEAEQEHGTSSESQLVQPTLAEGPRAEESTMKGISSEDPFLDMPPIAETSMQVFPVREATPERFPLEEPKQEIASPIKLEEPAGLTKAPESQGALLLDQSKNETSAQETTQSGPRENAHEAEETPTQKLVVQDDLRQSYDQLKADQQPVEEKGSPRDIDSKIAPAKELESEEQATDKPSTSDIATPEPAPTVPGEDSQATSSNAPKDTDQTAEPIPELVSGHPKLGDSQDFDLDREIIGTTSEHSSEANKQHGSLATSQPEDMVEDVSTEQGKKVGTSIETPQNYADDSPELPLMLSKDENKKSDTEVKPDLLLDTQVSSVQDRSFISVAAQPIAHTPEGIDATDNQAPEPRERESAGTENEHQSTQSNQTQVVMQLPIRTISPEVISEGKELKNDDLMEDETSPKVQDVAELASPKGLSGGHKEGQDEDREITKNEAHDEEDNIDYSTLREKWERKTRNDEPATETPRKTILDTLNIESPVLARETIRKLFESRGHIPGLPGLPKRKEPETSEVVQERDNLDMSEEQKPDSPSKGVHLPSMSVPTTPNFGRHSPGNLAPVEEETKEELESESPSRPWGITRRFTDGRTMSRDSGVAMDALWPLRLNLVNELAKRDSGVHVREEPESTETKQEEDYTKVEENDTQVRSGSGSQDEARQPSRPSTPKPDAKEVQEEVQEEAQPSENKIPAPSTPIRRKEPIEEKEKAKSTNELAVKKTRQSKSADQLVPSEPLMAMAATTTLSRQDQRSASEKVARDANASPILGKQPRRSASNTSLSRLRTPEPLTFWPEGSGSYARTNTPPLRRRAKRMSGDLRSLGQPTTEDPNLPSSKDLSPDRQALDNTTPIANEGRVRARDMTDVYDGYGEGRIGSPRSPSKPHSMRRRQSMQVLELEARVEQLLAENQALAQARQQAEQSLTQRTTSALTERDAEIEGLKASLQWLQKEVTRLTEVNEGLHSANNVLALQHTEKYSRLERQHATAAQELEEYRGSRGQYNKTLQEKDAEIQDLRAQLETYKEQIREMKEQILASKPPDAEFLRLRDEDHFDHRCQQLCSHVQQWVLRFSKFSDMRASRLTSEINDEKIIDRLDNSVLDGSEVDSYLRDRVKRRDVFMSMTMNMIWEFVFTRYLFGMDREQRQKLKSVEKLLTEVGPPQAVRQWRAVTLTLLSKRPAFGDQRNQDTEAVVQAILRTLSMILPPPSNMEAQIQSQLRRVMREAVDLSIEMRTQRAEYVMLPPLQPEYDANGDLVQTVAFNAALMNERSGDTVSNEELEAQGAIVRCVLFPLVVKKGDDNGVGDDEIVVCPAQVLVSKARSRTATPTSDKPMSSRNPTPSTMGPTSMVSVNMPDAMRSVAGSTWSVD